MNEPVNTASIGDNKLLAGHCANCGIELVRPTMGYMIEELDVCRPCYFAYLTQLKEAANPALADITD